MRRECLYCFAWTLIIVGCGGETNLGDADDTSAPTEDSATGADGAVTEGDGDTIEVSTDTADTNAGPDVVVGPVTSCEGQADETLCLSDSPCSTEGTCVAGVCQPDTPCECLQDADCTQPENPCDGAVVCDTAGEMPACVLDPETVVVCEPATDPCLSNACQTDTGACAEVPVADGAPCDDGDACTDADGCMAGACAGATPVSCDDDQFCNGLETCDGLVGCVGGEAPDLDDGVDCTADTCDEAQDLPVHTPDDQACSNGFFCDGTEVCDAVEGCLDGDVPVVDDGVACTDDACSEATDEVLHLTNDSLCDDGLFCTGAETCDAELDCQVGEPPALDDAVDCTVDTCDDELDEVVHTEDPSLCDDDNPCTADLCDAAEGCSQAVDDAGLCSDEDPCAGGDHCSDTVCVGSPILSEGPVCNNVDDDCDGATDEDCSYRLNGHMLGDGYGTSADDTGAAIKGSVGTPRIMGTSSNGTWTLKSGLPTAKEN